MRMAYVTCRQTVSSETGYGYHYAKTVRLCLMDRYRP
jgi:hypothetical protein